MSKETFDFSEALRRMRQGRMVRRASDYNKVYKILKEEKLPYDYSIYVTYRCKENLKYCHDSTNIGKGLPIFREHMLFASDILATDWEEVE